MPELYVRPRLLIESVQWTGNNLNDIVVFFNKYCTFKVYFNLGYIEISSEVNHDLKNITLKYNDWATREKGCEHITIYSNGEFARTFTKDDHLLRVAKFMCPTCINLLYDSELIKKG